MSRKPRSDSKLIGLSPAQQEQLTQWLTVDNLSYEVVRIRVQEEFGCKTSVGALQHYYMAVARPANYLAAKGQADAFARLAEGQFDEATLKRLQQLSFELAVSPQPDVTTIKALLKIVGDSHKLTIARERLALDSRKVKLLEAKAAQAEAAEGVTRDTTLTPAQREQRLKEIFGLK